MKKRSKTLLDRVRAIESAFKWVQSIRPHLSDCIIVSAILIKRGVVTREDIENEYDNIMKKDI